MNYLVVLVLQREMLLFVSRGSGSEGRCWVQHKNLILIYGIGGEVRTA